MKTYEYAEDPNPEPRSHPWVDAVGNPNARYYDLKRQPERIRSSLEDFRPWQRYSAVEDFYQLLERINHLQSALESNDCAFIGPEHNEDVSIQKALQCSGRLMILFRALTRNTAGSDVEWLKDQLHIELAELDPEFNCGVVGTNIVPVRYLELPEADSQQLGSQLMICFWSWGDSEAETMLNLARLMKNLSRALRRVSTRLAA